MFHQVRSFQMATDGGHKFSIVLFDFFEFRLTRVFLDVFQNYQQKLKRDGIFWVAHDSVLELLDSVGEILEMTRIIFLLDFGLNELVLYFFLYKLN